MVSSLEEDESGRRPPMVPERQLRQKNLSPTPQAPLPEQNRMHSSENDTDLQKLWNQRKRPIKYVHSTQDSPE